MDFALSWHMGMRHGALLEPAGCVPGSAGCLLLHVYEVTEVSSIYVVDCLQKARRVGACTRGFLLHGHMHAAREGVARGHTRLTRAPGSTPGAQAPPAAPQRIFI